MIQNCLFLCRWKTNSLVHRTGFRGTGNGKFLSFLLLKRPPEWIAFPLQLEANKREKQHFQFSNPSTPSHSKARSPKLAGSLQGLVILISRFTNSNCSIVMVLILFLFPSISKIRFKLLHFSNGKKKKNLVHVHKFECLNQVPMQCLRKTLNQEENNYYF